MPKVALCISGFIRNATDTYPSIKKNIIDKFDIDVFIYSYKSTVKHKSIYKIRQSPDTSDEDIIVKLYQPKKYVFNEFSNDFVNNIVLKNRPDEYKQLLADYANDSLESKYVTKHVNQYCMFYNVYKCNELKKEYESENGFKYDYVIRTRFDMSINDSKYLDCLSYLNDNNIMIIGPAQHNYTIYDHFALGQSMSMDKYSNLYSEIYDVLLSLNLDDKYKKLSLPETLIGFYILKICKMSYLTSPISMEIYRKNELETLCLKPIAFCDKFVLTDLAEVRYINDKISRIKICEK